MCSPIIYFLQCIGKTFLRRFRNFIQCFYKCRSSLEPCNRPGGMLEIDLSTNNLPEHDDSEERILILNNGQHQDSVLYRLKKGWKVNFKVGTSFLGKTLDLFINHPLSADQPFNRHTYYQLSWVDESAIIYLTRSGSFHYYLSEVNKNAKNPVASGYLLVDPELKIGGKELPLDCIQIQTVLSKCLGPFSTWENKLLVARNTGYNAIHFTPIQQLGCSKSAYSLSDQMKINSNFNDDNTIVTYDDIERFVNKMRVEWKMLSICDIVLNHTANESPFLVYHPECAYNCFNSPHLRPAYILDAALSEFTTEVAIGKWELKGIPMIETEEHLNAIAHALRTYILPFIKIHEMYTVDVNEIVATFLNLARNILPDKENEINPITKIKVIQDPGFRRLQSTIDMQLALQIYNIFRNDCYDEETRLKRCAEALKNDLEKLNTEITNNINDDLNLAISNTIANIRYFRVQHDGPKIKEISEKNPLTPRYFTDYGAPTSFAEKESIMYSENGRYLMAHNGWVLNGDPLKNFADSDSKVYLRRELIAWGDSVKLRYGEKQEDCPFLWQYMTAYVEQTAKIFDGIRLDNCHSTPIPVAEYMLDNARQIRPNLYVVAELFTNSDQKDNIFVNRLGITSLIREALAAWDSHEEGRLIYRYGGEPVGAFLQSRKQPLTPSIAHALLMDVTHDNPSVIEKRSVFDILPNAALVSIACCASGSNRGYDELVPHHIHVVDETRQYVSWTDDDNLADNIGLINLKTGIIAGKKALNDLHYVLGQQKFSQIFVDQIDCDIVAVTRHSPISHESVILIVFSVFNHPNSEAHDLRRDIKPLRVEGVVEEIILEASFSHVDIKNSLFGKLVRPFSLPIEYKKDENFINGLSDEYTLNLKQHIQCCDSAMIEKVDSGDPKITQLNFVNFQPGFVIALRIGMHANVKPALEQLQDTILQITSDKESDVHTIISRMDFADLNKTLYRCDQEERDETMDRFGTYQVPGYSSLVYAGLQGYMSVMTNARAENILGHTICNNLRDGNWLIDYVWRRLKEDDGTEPLGTWLEQKVEPLKLIPRYLLPCYFDAIISNIYTILIAHCHDLMSNFVKNGSTFIKLLSLVSIQMCGTLKSSPLPDLSPNLKPPKPKIKICDGEIKQNCLTLAAGLPYFTTGYLRNWGRDTFISLRGLLLLTGRYAEARFIILGFAGTLRHGLIPNLLDKGYNARYNCRDAVWWWLYSIKCYIEEVPDGINILSDSVSRLFPTDDSPPLPAGECDQPLYDVIQEALTVHFQGLYFRERNAGKQIDEHMTEQGFYVQIGVNPETGFVFGGNEANCGTWMDKMGSSEVPNNKGQPATPRDGSAVEIVGLSKCVISFLAELYKQNLFPYGSVQRKYLDGTTVTWSYNAWADEISLNFEKHFFINTFQTNDEQGSDLIHRRGIYKDCYGATQKWADYQLRPNFPIAMVVAPELFTPKHAWHALKKAEELLLGPLGMKTLDPSDWKYNGYYENCLKENVDVNTAHGWNYHQGPEWVWPLGYFLRARLHFGSLLCTTKDQIRHLVEWTEAVLSKHFKYISLHNEWRGLPELTNKNGAFCKSSCYSQAWSASCILELHVAQLKLEKASYRSKADDTNMYFSTDMVVVPHTETHAYSSLHVDETTNMQTCKIVAADSTSVRDNAPTTAENGLISAIDRKNDNINFDNPSYNPFHSAGDSIENSSDVNIHAQLMHEAEQVHEVGDEVGCIKNQWNVKNHNRQYAMTTNNNIESEATSVRTLPNVDHVYEEIKAIKWPDNSDEYSELYKEHSPITAKTLIDTLLLPQREICKKCTRLCCSPVYTDRLIYAKKSLYAIEVVLCQRHDVSCFNYCSLREGSDDIFRSQHGRNDYMLVYSYTKTNTAGIFYSNWWPQDVFDLESELKPNIYVISRARNAVTNTQLYHRNINNYYMRISRVGYAPMTFYSDRIAKHISYNNDLQDSLTYQTHRWRDYNIEERRKRPSLLLLEPLLLMPEMTSSKRDKSNKNQSERIKIVRIVIAYALSFFILMSITFYVVYFT